MSARWFRWGLLGAFLLQTALLAWMIVDRALLLENGREVRLSVVPVDPRDFLRGDYVVLRYPISELRTDRLAGDDNFDYFDPIYVSLEEDAGGWQARAVHRTPPDDGVYLRGTVEYATTQDQCVSAPNCMELGVTYDLERFFVPEGRGRELETLRNDQRMSVDVAVADGGQAALKRLLVDGEVRYEERLY